jgi:hypothetical protein
MRIAIEYQYSDNYAICYLCRCNTSECKMDFGSYLYSENDQKPAYSKT